jgi:putative endonuclease
MPEIAWFYILRLRSGKFYTGATTDLEQRFKDHLSGNACRTTRLDPPVALIHSEECQTFSDARKREAQIKRSTCKELIEPGLAMLARPRRWMITL